jgi:hypothetical protein
MNLLQAFGIDEATDKLCKIAGIEVMDWQRMTVRVIRPSAIILDECGDTACKKCGEETGWGFNYCKDCRA